jgi:hypothetical protein
VVITLALLKGEMVSDGLFLRQCMKFAKCKRGARVGRQAETMPAEDSRMTHVQDCASVPVDLNRDRETRLEEELCIQVRSEGTN